MNDPPLMLAELTAWRPGAELDTAHGFAIVTNDMRSGMIDIHDRWPVALSPDAARRWENPSTPLMTPASYSKTASQNQPFLWHRVRQEVGNTKYQLPDAIEPV